MKFCCYVSYVLLCAAKQNIMTAIKKMVAVALDQQKQKLKLCGKPELIVRF